MSREQLINEAISKALGRFYCMETDRIDLKVRYLGERFMAGERLRPVAYCKATARVSVFDCVDDDTEAPAPAPRQLRKLRVRPIEPVTNGQ